MSDIKHVVWIPFTMDRPTLVLDEKWVVARIEMFNKYCLASLLNQSHKDFEIWLGCGERNRHLTDSQKWHPKINLVYDHGAQKLEELKKRGPAFVAWSRIDSDDLYNKKAIKTIDKLCGKHADSKKLVGLIFRNIVIWQQLTGFVLVNRRLKSTPPFVTRIYPRRLYSDYEYWRNTFFVPHGNRTRDALDRVIECGEQIVCVVKHGTNISHVKHGIAAPTPNIPKIRLRPNVLTCPTLVRKCLAQYGISPEGAESRPQVIFSKDKNFVPFIRAGRYPE